MTLKFEPTELTDSELKLQAEVREFLESELPRGSFHPGLGFAAPKDPEFSKKLAARGWIGMALPRQYGGGDRSAVDRFVVVEELLRWGAPLAHHWFADRQSGPLLVRFGTEEQKQRFLPGICRGELSFSIGMSEPDAGSDLASVATSARRVDGGWVVNGTKIWTTHAHQHDWMLTLVRTGGDEDRHRGLSQMLVPLTSASVEVNPIPYLDGSAEFNEVVLTDCFVPDSDVIGEIGNGWTQVTSELVFERGGPDRFLSTYVVVEEFLRRADAAALDDETLVVLGSAAARWWGLRGLGLSLARAIDRKSSSGVGEASLLKEMGTRFEQDVLEAVRQLADLELVMDAGSTSDRLFVEAILSAPSFTIRGGTIEVLRSLIAKGLR